MSKSSIAGNTRGGGIGSSSQQGFWTKSSRGTSEKSRLGILAQQRKFVTRIIRDAGGVTSDRHLTGWVRSAHTAPYRKFGFTLAEVLITLGVIGVVAALTMPMLMANFRARQYKVKFQKTLSVMNQAVKLNKAKYDFDFSDAYCIFGHGWMSADYTKCTVTSDPKTVTSFCAIFNANLSNARYDDFNEFYEYKSKVTQSSYDYTTDSFARYILPDGSSFFIQGYWYDGDCVKDSEYPCYTIIDINGLQGPNKEVTCTTGTLSFDLNEPCTVSNEDITDIFPIKLYDDVVVPATNAASAVLQSK